MIRPSEAPNWRSHWKTQMAMAIFCGLLAAVAFLFAITGWGANDPAFYAVSGVIVGLAAIT